MAATTDSTSANHSDKMELKKRSGLSKGRPPHAHKPVSSMKSKSNRKLINTTHQLNKALALATAQNDTAAIQTLQTKLAELGGLEKYQLASIQGQSGERGGDSSTVLLDFLTPIKPVLASLHQQQKQIRLLEIGALSIKNACAKSGLFDLTRIDLHSQDPGITQQDFMKRPLPRFKEDKFDLVSLSLVLNFVPSPEERGEMLRRTSKFLDRRRQRIVPVAAEGKPGIGKEEAEAREALLDQFLPSLFLVVPAPCVSNSRYCNEERLTLMMASLGYVLVRIKRTEKIYYSLWQLRDPFVLEEQNFPKKQVCPGAGRNNFCIVLKP